LVLKMKPYAEQFYKSQAWKKLRDTYFQKKAGLCERCAKDGLIVPGVIVHHKTYITPENINDTNITLSESNLEVLCRSCHEKEHKGITKRYTVDELGRIEPN